MGTAKRRVEWVDGTLFRDGWLARYTLGGGSLRSVEVPPELLDRFTTFWLAREDLPAYEPVDPATRRVIALVRKVIQRGTAPPLHPEAERLLLIDGGLGDDVVPTGLPGDVAPALQIPFGAAPGVERSPFGPPGIVTGRDLPYDSDEERRFHQTWVPEQLGEEWVQWFVPQASLDLLLVAAGRRGGGDRRVDFLVAAPWVKSFVVEIDGGGHGGQVEVDQARDRELRNADYDVIRIPTSELAAGAGPSLDRLRACCSPGPGRSTDKALRMVAAASQVHRLVLCLLEALAAGFVAGERWVVEVHDDVGDAVSLVRPYLDLLAAASLLWGEELLAPRLVQFHGARTVTFELVNGRYAEVTAEPEPVDVIVHLELKSTPVVDLPATDGRVPRIVARGAHLPVEVRDVAPEGADRVAVVAAEAAVTRALETFLLAVFAKESFRPGQLDALLEVLAGRDSMVLLPTGAGKSLIYQLAGLCMPGRTLVIDPLISLIEDQVRGLVRNGIDRVCWITGDRSQAQGREALEDEIESADALFVLVTPERLQRQGFRDALAGLTVRTPINLAVVDEAHCVSEWGHDFRTAYLRLGETIAAICRGRDGRRPPVLALTGTASRVVLRDALHELGIEEQTERTIVRPATFDRKELHFEVLVCEPARALAMLRAAVRKLPDDFGVPAATFFAGRGRRTSPGIVFCQAVNGSRGVVEVATSLSSIVGRPPVIYAGKQPKNYAGNWADDKRADAEAFKADEAPVLVATKAFGMGIDKPNVRWIVHYGLPGSIESYYQEVGRAGRDGGEARCALVFAELDHGRSEELLAPDAELAAVKQRLAALTPFVDDDDVTGALFFHNQSFRGEHDEHSELVSVAEVLQLGRAAERKLPFGGDQDRARRERALHRLRLLGVVRKYLVASGRFDVTLAEATPAIVRRSLLTYVERSQPGRLEAIQAEVDTLPVQRLDDAIDRYGRILVDFVYETVERSRRRSLREMWLLATQSRGDQDIRRRILDYLADGDILPLLTQLAEQVAMAPDDWIEAYDRVISVADAREWRGATGRLLASYPDHPGLLVGRAIAELVDPEGDMAEFATNLDAAIAAAPRYQLADVEALLEWLAEFAGRPVVGHDRPGRAWDAALAQLSRLGRTAPVRARLPVLVTAARTDPAAGVVYPADRLDHQNDETEGLLELLAGRYG